MDYEYSQLYNAFENENKDKLGNGPLELGFAQKSDLTDALNELRNSENPNIDKQMAAIKEAYILFVTSVYNYDDAWFTERGLKPLPACKRDCEEIVKIFGASNFKSNPRIVVDENDVGGSIGLGQDPYHYCNVSLNEG